jgi:dimethylargininase
MGAWAIVRSVPSSFAGALCAEPPDPPIDVARARAQHADYVRALFDAGVEVVTVAADEACPDCCFVEDTAVLVGDAALVTCPGAPSRRGEVEPVAAALARRAGVVVRMTAPATLDGGDCLLLGATIYVGRSARSNRDGIARLADVAGIHGIPVVAVDMPPGILHFKTVCSPLGDDTVLLAEGTIPPSTFAGARVLVVPARERDAANAVAVGRTVLVAAGAPATAELVDRAGFEVRPVDTSEMRKADGALTCLSIIGGQSASRAG